MMVMYAFYVAFVLQWKQFLALGEDMEDGAVEEMIAAQRPEQCAVLIYTVRKKFMIIASS